MTAAFRASRRPPLLQVAKSALAAIAAWLLAGLIVPGTLPVFAAIAALLVVQPSVNQSVTKAIERSVGVIAGVVVASGLVLLLGQNTWVVLVAVVAALFVAWSLRMTTGTSNQVAISALLVLALGAATPDYAAARVVETVIGAIIGFVINFVVVAPVALSPARDAVDALGAEISASLDRLADALTTDQRPAQLNELMITARLMRPMVDNAESVIATAAESLALNPRGRRHRAELERLTLALERERPLVTQVIAMTRAVYDRYDHTLTTEPTVTAIAEQLRRAAHDMRRRMRRVSPDYTSTATTSIPALTAPLSVAPPSSGHWIVVGFLLEELRRIHESLADDSGA